ncbi:MAG TPA: virulence RhuM family protein [Candidatus Acidoferrum sp.]|nr:virulence RhuM family protein [Candidatus Acidoferrum sp.]
MKPKSELILYQTEDNRTRIEVRLENETVWLTQAQMSELFQRERSVITKHIRNIFEEGELVEEAVCANYAQTAADGKTYQTAYYNLDVIISVGYRVKSHRGTQFRQWATQRLRELIVKGFTLDDDRLKQGGTRNVYFDELLQRIREIRLSERNFYRKICDIYRTSIDYDPGAEMARRFFQTVQNKMHWAIHGHTAAEVIHMRADARKPHMGLTSWEGAKVRKPDVAIAKNYLSEDALKKLGLVVTQYLDFAELQALERRPMTMRDWIAKLDAFLRAGDREILEHAGGITAGEAKRKAELEFDKFEARRRQLEDAEAEAGFAQEIEDLAKTAKQIKPSKRKK